MKTFSDRFILSTNPSLSERDLEMLDKFDKEFDAVSVGRDLLQWDISTILSWLVLLKLPYKVAAKLIYTTVSFERFIYVDDSGKIRTWERWSDIPEIIEQVNKMNRLLGYAC